MIFEIMHFWICIMQQCIKQYQSLWLIKETVICKTFSWTILTWSTFLFQFYTPKMLPSTLMKLWWIVNIYWCMLPFRFLSISDFRFLCYEFLCLKKGGFSSFQTNTHKRFHKILWNFGELFIICWLKLPSNFVISDFTFFQLWIFIL